MLTSVLNAVFGQDTMAPIRNAPHELYMARSLRRARIYFRVIITVIFPISKMETLLETTSYSAPVRQVWMSFVAVIKYDIRLSTA